MDGSNPCPALHSVCVTSLQLEYICILRLPSLRQRHNDDMALRSALNCYSVTVIIGFYICTANAYILTSSVRIMGQFEGERVETLFPLLNCLTTHCAPLPAKNAQDCMILHMGHNLHFCSGYLRTSREASTVLGPRH